MTPLSRALAVATALLAPLTLSGRPAAYSDLVPLGAETAGLLYETGTNGPYERIEFRRLPARTTR
ncbi:sialidase family protein [Streptomyces sp. NPDC004596]|uniref:sialidase family protein n=1 Tax=Streptomyces sp. DSM 118148 TaxID=3448667 RepID=UPI004040240A